MVATSSLSALSTPLPPPAVILSAPPAPPTNPAMQKPYMTFEDLPELPPADVLVVLAHPDDEIAGLSGTIDQLARSGKSVQVVYATNGSGGEDVSGRNLSDDVLGDVRSYEAVQAARSLNAERPPLILDFTDGKTDAFPDALKAQLRAVLLQIQPSMLLMANPQDGITGHPDHKNVARYLQEELDALGEGRTLRDQQDRQKIAKLLQSGAVYQAFFPQSAANPFRQFFPLSNPSWRGVQFQPDANADLKVFLPPDVRARKAQSMGQHRSQYRNEDIQNLAGFYSMYPYETFTRYQIKTGQALPQFQPSLAVLQNTNPVNSPAPSTIRLLA
jgi:LmbE family N-acetylglucosaminyl deacetylase